MTRHREDARLYAGNDDFKDFEALKERLSRARPKDTAMDYAQRRGFEVAVEPMRQATPHEPGRGEDQAFDAIERFKVAECEFIKAAERFGLDPDAKLRVAEARQRMSWAAEEISKDGDLMRQAKAARVVEHVQSLIRENRRGMSKEQGFEWSADDSQTLDAKRMAEDVRRLLLLRQPGSPIDNNICEQVLKRAVLHRKILCFTAPWAAPRWAISS
jgi:hypothetical protein